MTQLHLHDGKWCGKVNDKFVPVVLGDQITLNGKVIVALVPVMDMKGHLAWTEPYRGLHAAFEDWYYRTSSGIVFSMTRGRIAPVVTVFPTYVVRRGAETVVLNS